MSTIVMYILCRSLSVLLFLTHIRRINVCIIIIDIIISPEMFYPAFVCLFLQVTSTSRRNTDRISLKNFIKSRLSDKENTIKF